ncbi:MAG TPA: L,D-transpeptidase family protein [Gammaproteobacteria bacterium]
MARWLLLLLVLLPLILVPALAAEKADLVIVEKSKTRLYLLKDNKVFKTYRIALGSKPNGHKQQEGDQRTPEGRYILDFKKIDSAFYKAIRISYPNEADIKRAAELGVDPGGQIMIHGQKNSFSKVSFTRQSKNWTDGCIAVTNSAMDQIWDAVDPGTPIVIKP